MSQIFKPNVGGGGGIVNSVTGTNGVTAAPTTGNVVVSGVNATTSTVGVASFNPADFTVSGAGEVSTINNGTITSVLTAHATPQFALVGTTETVDFNLSNLVLGTSLPALAGGNENVGMGQNVMQALTSASGSTCVGWNSGAAITSGGLNCFYGAIAGQDVTTGNANCAIGTNAMNNLVTGSRNIFLGNDCGVNYNSSESSNILIGEINTAGGESNTIRLGQQGSLLGQQNRCFVAGIVGVTTANSQIVTINSATGQLGVGNAPEVWLDEATSFSAVAGDGYFVTGTATASLPVATQGNTIKFIVDGANLLTIQANTGQKIQLGTAISATAGTAVNTGAVTGSTITLVFRAADSIWFGLADVGTWGIT